MQEKDLTKSLFLIAIISIGWGVAFVSLAILLEGMAPMQVLAARWTITAVLFLVLIAMGKVRIRVRGQGRNTAFLFLAGLFEPCAYSICEAYGIKLTSASTSAIFVASIPSMTLILGILLFHHRADLKLVLSLLITFAGVIIATFFSPTFSMGGTRTGMLCMTLGVIAASMYSLSSKKASESFDAASVTAIMAFEGAVLFNKEHAEKIIKFIQKNKSADTLLVHCYGGESRSRAVCAFAAKMLGSDNSRYFETGHPNGVVYETLLEVWENRE